MTVVLVADGDADIRDLVALKLEQAGLEVIAVEDGEAALEQARAQQPGRWVGAVEKTDTTVTVRLPVH